VNVSVGLLEGQGAIEVELTGSFRDSTGRLLDPGRHRFTSAAELRPMEVAACSFALDEVTIGIGFHWERRERQVFRGTLRIVRRGTGFTAINDVPLEEYVTSVISSEMSAACPLELLKAHAVISRSWLRFPKDGAVRAGSPPPGVSEREIVRWYGREAHQGFDVCADDHCQRYQGITKAFSPAASEAVRQTAGEMLRYEGAVCDTRFSKCCGGITERYSTAWEDREIPYLESLYDGPPSSAGAVEPAVSLPVAERWIRAAPPAYCNTRNADLLARILPGFDQETRDFYRWRVEYTTEELGDLIESRLGVALGRIVDLVPLQRGPSGRVYRLRIVGERDHVVVGKELEIRRALSRSHLYSSAFIVDREPGGFILTGAGWGHGVGLCQIGAACMAGAGKSYREILAHYYPRTECVSA
jgi:stage II sporulation protein D